jgi:G:T-mismatch repair DNA endonuclease (very short patch repair protein)
LAADRDAEPVRTRDDRAVVVPLKVTNMAALFEADRLHGIIVGSADDWHKAGVSRRRLESLVGAGQLVRVRHGAYATAGIMAKATATISGEGGIPAPAHPGLMHAVAVAAALARGRHDGVGSHESAARMYGMPLFREQTWGVAGDTVIAGAGAGTGAAPASAPTPALAPAPAPGSDVGEAVTLTMPPDARTRRSGHFDITCHIAALPSSHVVQAYFDVPITSAARTVVDIARTATFKEGVVAADCALHNRTATAREMRQVIAACKGWPGTEKARRVADFASNQPESVIESCARVVFHEHGLPAPEMQVDLHDSHDRLIARPDFVWPQYRTIALTDGMFKYRARSAVRKHLDREARLDTEGWKVIHVTWKELFGDEAGLIARVSRALS